MSKIKFGNFITYKGKNLATPKAKAVKGNLVFAEITEGADKGYYIFGGVAEGHLVTYDVFNVLKAEVAALNTKVGDLSIGEGESKKTYKDVPAYVAAYVDSRLKALEAYKVKDVVVGANSIVSENGIVTLGNAAEKNVAIAIAKDNTDLATAGQVYAAIDAIPEVVVAQGTGIAVGSTTADGKTTYTVSVDSTIATTSYVDEKIGKLGDVMSFIGVVEVKPTDKNVTLVGSTTAVEATNGDVVTVQTSGEEYIWTGAEWIEIGKVGADEAVTSLGNVKGDITLGNGLSMVGQQLTVTFPEVDVQGKQKTTTVKGKAAIGVTGVVDGNNTEYEVSLKLSTSGNVTLQQDSTHGLTAHVDADDLDYTYASATASNVKAALNELYDDKEVVSQALVDLKSDVSDLKSGISGLDTRLDTIEANYVKSVTLENPTEDSPYISITPNKGDVKINLNVVKTEAAIKQDEADDALVSAAGLRDYSKAENIVVTGITGESHVQGALEDLYAQIATLNSDVKDASEITYTAGTTGSTATNVEAALDDLYTQLATLDGAVVKSVTGDTYVGATTVNGAVTLTTDIATAVDVSDIDDYTAATATGLATDAYVQDYVAYALAWEDISDLNAEQKPGGEIEMGS